MTEFQGPPSFSPNPTRWGFICAFLAALFSVTDAHADRLQLIKTRGVVIVGVKLDYPPFGMFDGSGAAVGLEHDLAADLAQRLGVRLSKVGVTASNRFEKLEDGSVDIVLATTGDTAERRELATLIEPDYYASGVTLMMRPSTPYTDWRNLRGQTVCATQGAYFNRPMALRYLLDLQMYNNERDAKLALRDGRCAGWMYDDTAILGDLMTTEWRGYIAPLPPQLVLPWAIAIGRSERGGPFERVIGDIVADWHRTGFLIERETHWGLKPTEFLADMHTVWNERGENGQLLCAREKDGQWPARCRNKAFLTAADTSGLERVGLFVREKIGLDLSPFYDRYDRTQFASGLLITLLLSIACLTASVLFGVLGAFLVELRTPLLSRLCLAGVTFARMTPPLLQIYVLMFGVGSMVSTRFGLLLNPFFVVTTCLSVYTGAGVAAALIDAIAHIRDKQSDFRLTLATLPRVLRLSSGPIKVALVNVVKATAMASTVAVPDLLSASTSIISERGNVVVVMNLLMLTFIVLVSSVVRTLVAIERKILL